MEPEVIEQEFYIGQIFYAPYPPEAATWCDNNNAIIVEKHKEEETEEGVVDVRYYEIIEKPEPTTDEKKAAVRAVRDGYLNGIEWRVSRYRDQVEIGTETTDSNTTYIKILQYMQYLRDYPESGDTWFEQNPLTFDEWKEK